MVSKAPKPETANYETWCRADLWTIERAILLLLNAETLPSNNYYSSGRCSTPKEQAIYDDFMKIWRIAESSLKTGVLKKIGKSYPSLLSEILPGDFINWARLKGYQIPDELEKINTVTQVEAMGLDEEGKKVNIKSTTKSQRNSQRNEIAKKWLDTKKTEETEAMTNKEILEELKLFSPNDKNLFTSGGDDWLNRDHSVIPKRKPGRKPSKPSK